MRSDTPGADAAEIEFSVAYYGGRLTLQGDVGSTANEAILRNSISRLFPDAETSINLRWRSDLPPGWALAADLTLQAVSSSQSATALVSTKRVYLRGISTDGESWDKALERLREALPPGMKLQSDVVVLHGGESHSRQCKLLFDAAVRSRKIRFAPSSTKLGSDAFALLDEIAEIAFDCPAAIFTITGHSDGGVGAAAGQLAMARTRTIIDYMRTRGIDERRLIDGHPDPTGSGHNPAAQARLEISLPKDRTEP